MFLAADTPEPMFLLQFLLVVGLFASVGGNIAQMMNSRRTQKRQVSFEGEFVESCEFEKQTTHNREEHAFLHKRISDGDSSVELQIEALRKEIKEDVSGVHDRVNAVLAAVSELRGEVRNKK